jgi:hypothetical protein
VKLWRKQRPQPEPSLVLWPVKDSMGRLLLVKASRVTDDRVRIELTDEFGSTVTLFDSLTDTIKARA